MVRLVELYDPWRELDVTKAQVIKHGRQRKKYSARRSRNYDLGRINFFARQYAEGEKVEPIILDNVCYAGCIYPTPVLVDGHHRLCAAHLTGMQKIPSSYSGRLDLLDYLKGRRKTKPE